MGKSYTWHYCKVCGKKMFAPCNRVYCSDECKHSTGVNEEEIIKLYDSNSGMTYSEMAAVIGCSVSTFRSICVSAGKKKPLTKFQYQVKSLYECGNSISDISDILRVQRKQVISTLNKIGIVIKFNPEKLMCERCGGWFLQSSPNQKYCCVECQKSDSHAKNDIKRRIREKQAYVDNDITLQKVYNKWKGICWICGLECNWEDTDTIKGKKYAKKMYPSVDHVIPLSKGGLHSWNNVKLAHFGCNASKGVNVV